jgi:RHS repeat-associated protein
VASVPDAAGTTSYTYDTAVSGSQAYDPWGKVTAATGTPQGLLGYQSAWSDPVSGKDLMGARWYAPSAGDFTSADTVQVSPDPDPVAGNPFAYASDEPLDVTDPSGHGCGIFSVVGDYENGYVRYDMAPEFDSEFSSPYKFPYVTTSGGTGYEWQIPANMVDRFNELTVNRGWVPWEP